MKNSIWNAAGALLFLIISFVILFLLAGCCKGNVDAQREVENKAITNSLRTVEFNGHSYIVYREEYGTKNFGGITHNPECGCRAIEYYGFEVGNFCSCEEDDFIQ